MDQMNLSSKPTQAVSPASTDETHWRLRLHTLDSLDIGEVEARRNLHYGSWSYRGVSDVFDEWVKNGNISGYNYTSYNEVKVVKECDAIGTPLVYVYDYLIELRGYGFTNAQLLAALRDLFSATSMQLVQVFNMQSNAPLLAYGKCDLYMDSMLSWPDEFPTEWRRTSTYNAEEIKCTFVFADGVKDRPFLPQALVKKYDWNVYYTDEAGKFNHIVVSAPTLREVLNFLDQPGYFDITEISRRS